MQKLTFAHDFAAPLPAVRVGTGYDVHRLEDGEELWLCGVRIEHSQGLAGHSDADVAIHALVDALLGAIGAGDIGRVAFGGKGRRLAPFRQIGIGILGADLHGAAVDGLPADATAWSVADKAAFVEDVRKALYASKIIAYAQCFDAIRAGAKEYNWNINLGAVSKIWRGGCIIRAQFLNRIADAYDKNPELQSLIFDPYFKQAVANSVSSWRQVVANASLAGIPVPAFASSLSYYDGLRSPRLSAALVQGQRDFFGAHTYKRVDMDGTFHTLWSGDRSEVEQAPSTH